MPDVIGVLAAAWPLLIVIALAVFLIRGARGPRRRMFRARNEHGNGAWARSEWSAGRRGGKTDGGGDSGGD